MLIYAVLNLCGVEIQPSSSCLQSHTEIMGEPVRWTLNDTGPTRTPPTNSPSLDLIAELCIVTTQKVLRYPFLKIPLDIVHDRRKAICPTSATLWWHRRTVGQRVWVSPGRHRPVPCVFKESPMNQLSPHVLSEDWTFKTCSRVFCEHGYCSVFSYFLKSVFLVSFC